MILDMLPTSFSTTLHWSAGDLALLYGSVAFDNTFQFRTGNKKWIIIIIIAAFERWINSHFLFCFACFFLVLPSHDVPLRSIDNWRQSVVSTYICLRSWHRRSVHRWVWRISHWQISCGPSAVKFFLKKIKIKTKKNKQIFVDIYMYILITFKSDSLFVCLC